MDGSLRFCLMAVGFTALVAGSVVPQDNRDRRHIVNNNGFSLMSELTFKPNGDCTIFGHYLTESVCRWVLRDKYEIYRFYYMNFVSPNPSLNIRVDMLRNGSCTVNSKLLNMEDCRGYMGVSRYDQAYVDVFGLPDIDIDDEGYCMMGDTELAPEDCPVIIGEALYTVLVSIHSYS